MITDAGVLVGARRDSPDAEQGGLTLMLPLKALRQRARLKLSRLLPGTGRGSLYPAVLLRRVAPRPRWCWSSPQ